MNDVFKKISLDCQVFNNESEFQTYLNKHWCTRNFVSYKLSDFDTKNLKPCDCICTDKNWITHRIELKYSKTDIINVNKLEFHQKSYLRRVHRNWWSALVIIYSKSHNAYIWYNIEDFL